MAIYVEYMQPATGDPAISVPAAVMRMGWQALAAGVEGLIHPPAAVVTQRGAGADMSVDVAPFYAIIAGGDVTDQGAYLVVSTTTVNVPGFSAPGSGSRTHRIVIQARDKRSNAGWSTYDAAVLPLLDTGSGEPAEPPSAETLAHVAIAAGQANISNSNITQGYQVLRSLLPVGPWSSFQNAPGAWNSTNAWVDFSSGNWPAVTFTVPPSGQVLITVTGAPNCSVNSGGNAYIAYRISGGDTRPALPQYAIGGASGIHQGSCRRLFTGLTPGATDTVTPQWFLTPAGAGAATDGGNGQIIVEAVQ